MSDSNLDTSFEVVDLETELELIHELESKLCSGKEGATAIQAQVQRSQLGLCSAESESEQERQRSEQIEEVMKKKIERIASQEASLRHQLYSYRKAMGECVAALEQLSAERTVGQDRFNSNSTNLEANVVALTMWIKARQVELGKWEWEMKANSLIEKTKDLLVASEKGVKEEGLPNPDSVKFPNLHDKEAAEAFFFAQIQKGEGMMEEDPEQGAFHLANAVAVCYQRADLMAIFAQTLPRGLYDLLAKAVPKAKLRLQASMAIDNNKVARDIRPIRRTPDDFDNPHGGKRTVVGETEVNRKERDE